MSVSAFTRNRLRHGLGSVRAGNEVVTALDSASVLLGLQLGAGIGGVFYVSSVTGSSGYDGLSEDRPKATIDQAVNLCTANKGDIIIVSQNHAESIAAAAGIDADVAGITIVGLGNDEQRPTITFTTATSADVDIDAADVTMINLLFKNDIDSQTFMIDVNSTGFSMLSCDFYEGSSKQWLTGIDLNGGSANACDRARIIGCRFFSIAVGANNAIKLAEVADMVVIQDCYIDGDFADAGIHNPTGKVMTNLLIDNCKVRNRQTGDHAIELVSACTGWATDNHLAGDTLGTILDPGSLFCSGNLEVAAIDTAAITTPPTVSDVAANLIGVDDADNAAATTNVVANVDGSVLERLEALMDPLSGYNPRMGFGVTKVSNLADGSGTDNLFTVTGRVLITSLTGEVTTVVGGAATMKLRDVTNSVDLCAATTIDTDAVGTMYALTSISANILNGTGATPVVGSIPNITGAQQVDVAVVGCVQAPITIAHVLDAADTGAVTWRLTYIPLVAGATVAAAA